MDTTKSHAIVLSALLCMGALTVSCSDSDPGTACGADSCEAGSICIDTVCRALCVNTSACGSGETCEGGACVPTYCLIDGKAVQKAVVSPDDPCSVCIPERSTVGYWQQEDGGPCDDGLYCTDGETCTAGICASNETPCDPFYPLCSEANKLCLCGPTSCDDGLFCNGAEFCSGVTGECGTEAAPSCAAPLAACNDSIGACAECADDDVCAAPNAYCVDGECRACVDCLCVYGEHDGGNGSCLPDGECVAGFTVAYRDVDGDGWGADPLGNECVPLALPEGWVTSGGDCDDDDPQLMGWTMGYLDSDGDGYTAASERMCLAGALPSSHIDSPHPPPALLLSGTTVDEDDTYGRERWSNIENGRIADGQHARCKPGDAGNECRYLVVSDFRADIAPGAIITGIEVQIVRHAVDLTEIVIFDASLRLRLDGVAIGDDKAATTVLWEETASTATYGGPFDLWGLDPVTLNQTVNQTLIQTVNQRGFEIAFSAMTLNNRRPMAHIDAIRLAIFLQDARDCDDSDPDVWSTVPLRPDSDGDGFGSGAGAETCIGDDVPVGQSGRRSEDCDDGVADVFPGQGLYFGTPRSNGSFDYDCDGADIAGPVEIHGGCACSGGCNPTSVTYVSAPAACGASNAVKQCSGACSTGACGNRSVNPATPCH